jgi:hypothetical protein
MIEAKPENLVGDRAYDSDPLDHALRQDGIEMIALYRSKAAHPTLERQQRACWRSAELAPNTD